MRVPESLNVSLMTLFLSRKGKLLKFLHFSLIISLTSMILSVILKMKLCIVAAPENEEIRPESLLVGLLTTGGAM